jgi:hypothetical protein
LEPQPTAAPKAFGLRWLHEKNFGFLTLFKNVAPNNPHAVASAKPTIEKTMNFNIATILAVIAILFVLLTYLTGAPLVPVAVILLGLAIIFGGSTFRRV